MIMPILRTVPNMPNPLTDDETDWVMPSIGARLLGVSIRTLANMADEHKIRCQKLPSGHRRYDRAELKALAEARVA